MAKFYGIVAYTVSEEEVDGVFTQKTVEKRPYFGDILQHRRSLDSSENLNDDVNISNDISIVADPFAYQHCYAIAYVEYMGVKWKVRSVEIERPRLILSLGGVYNEH